MSEFLSLLIAGIVTGSIYAVSASGLVVTYNTTGIFNFAHGAIGHDGLAYLFWQLWQGWGLQRHRLAGLSSWSWRPLGGVVIERVVMRPLYGAAITIRLAVTLGLLLLLVGARRHRSGTRRNTYIMPEFFNGNQVAIGEHQRVVRAAHHRRRGDRRGGVPPGVLQAHPHRVSPCAAVVDDPDLASLSGAPRRAASRGYAWMIGVMFAGVAGILLAPRAWTIIQTSPSSSSTGTRRPWWGGCAACR